MTNTEPGTCAREPERSTWGWPVTRDGDADPETTERIDSLRRMLLVGLCAVHGLNVPAKYLNCGEAEMLAEMLECFGSAEIAQSMLDCHAEDDRLGDGHWLPKEGQCVECGALAGQPHDFFYCLPDPEEDAAMMAALGDEDEDESED